MLSNLNYLRKEMLKKSIITLMLISTFASSSLFAKNAQLISLAAQQVKLTKKISHAYQSKASSASILSSIKTLEMGQIKLKKQAKHTSEIKNLLVYLNICVKELKALVRKPYSRENAQKVVDYGVSISEGSRYISKS